MGQRRHDNVVREGLWRILVLEKVQHGQKFEDRTRPTMQEEQREGVFPFREESGEMDRTRPYSFILDHNLEIWKGVDAPLLLAPVRVHPSLLRSREPFSSNP